jgi:dextranase
VHVQKINTLVLVATFVFGTISQTMAAPRITDLYPDRALYPPGSNVVILAEVYNPDASLFGGELAIEFVHLGHTVAHLPPHALSIEGGADELVSLAWQPPHEDYRGYQVVARIKDASDNVVWTATSAVDVSSDWRRFPRYGYVSHYWWGLDSEQTITDLKKYHINALQFYDWKWKHHVPYSPADS